MSEKALFFQGEIVSIGYGVLAVYLRIYYKIVYVHKFPPIVGAEMVPDFGTTSDLSIYNSDRTLRKETLVNFWSDTNLYQANGDWKGGEWGSNNLPTTDTTWCTGYFVGDLIEIRLIKEGIIPYPTRKSKPFEYSDEIIVNSENTAWSCNISINFNGYENIYSGYVCEQPMGQKAIDVLFVWKNIEGKRFVKILRRGNPHPSVDMPRLQMPGAGEHREPGNKITFKNEVIKAVEEEIGIGNDTLTDSYLLSIGTYDSDKRDPRYWKFSAEQDGRLIEFGIERKSSTNVYVLYFESNSHNEPIESEPSDMIEVNSKRWVNLESPILSNTTIWLVPEHSSYFSKTINILNEFDNLSHEDKLLKKINLN